MQGWVQGLAIYSFIGDHFSLAKKTMSFTSKIFLAYPLFVASIIASPSSFNVDTDFGISHRNSG